MIKRDGKGRFIKGSNNSWNKGMKGYTNSGSFTSKNSEGKNNIFYGKHHTEESKQKISMNSGMKNDPKAREKVSVALSGRRLTQEVRNKISIAMKKRVKQGIHNFWKGGISRDYQKLNHSLRNTDWRIWRERVFERDDYTCQRCGIRSGNGKAVYLEPHHKITVKECVDEGLYNLIYDVDNGLTLCRSCHKQVHGWNSAERPGWVKVRMNKNAFVTEALPN